MVILLHVAQEMHGQGLIVTEEHSKVEGIGDSLAAGTSMGKITSNLNELPFATLYFSWS